MFKIICKALSGNKVLFRRRGQVSLLFALMMPIFLLILGVVLDLGWYYLNVSRLQNAADAAAVAGANALIKKDDDDSISTIFSDYKNIKLVGKYPGKDSNKYRVDSIYELTAIENSNVIANEYVAKNLASDKDNIINSWTKTEVNSEQGLYTKDNNLYYVVKLKERIRHFFLPGWFDDMSAPVTAVALLSKTAINGDSQSSVPEMPDTPSVTYDEKVADVVIDEEQIKVMKKILNENMIVGNWQVQNYYKDPNHNPPQSDYYKVDEETGKETQKTEFELRFEYNFYTGAWNHFQDFYNHYNAGDFYRTQTITILDDVLFSTDNDGNDTIYRYGETSSVAATSATINTTVDPETGEKCRAYNPGIYARKTYKTFKSSNDLETAITESGTVGLPYTWKRVDSLNADFKVEANLKGWFDKNGEVNWDVSLDDFSNVTFSNTDWYTGGIAEADIKKLRIHTSINFDGAYPVRDPETDPIDVLWMRIESEPMLQHPDVKHNGEAVRITETSLNSVNQIIINANFANSAAENYRPYIIFYDGPEYYETNKEIRASKPVILNLKKAWRGVLYAANSPVIVIGAARDQFVGFVVAKEYRRLAEDSDFTEGGYRYFNNEFRKTEYFKNADGSFVDANGKATTSSLYKLPVYYANDDTEKTTRYYKVTKVTDENGITMFTDENGITMFVDDHGDIATVKLNDPPKKYGEYDNFGRTDFSTHGYKVLASSANNMLLSGN